MNIDKICEQLTIDEKIRLLGGVGDWHTYDCNGKIPSIMMTDGPHGIRKRLGILKPVSQQPVFQLQVQ